MSSSAVSDLENYRIQLQQVEAALIAEPDNEELCKLKADLLEIIQLQEEILSSSAADVGPAGSQMTEKLKWKVGDRCLAPSKNGQRHVAVIDGISQDRVAITFTSNGVKHMVRFSELTVAPVEEKKNYIFESNKNKSSGPKKEWQQERERRKQRAQKKEQRRKTLDETKEQEKSKWQSFNAKAANKQLKGLKRVEATSSAADGGKGAPSQDRKNLVSSRKEFSFGQTARGNMDSLF